MLVTKHDGTEMLLDIEKLKQRLHHVIDEKIDTRHVHIDTILQTTIQGSHNKMKTSVLDELLRQTTAYLSTKHPDYALLAGRLEVTNLHKYTPNTFSEVVNMLRNHVNPNNGRHNPLVSEELFQTVSQETKRIDDAIHMERDLDFDYFGFKTLERSYLLRITRKDGTTKIMERPQYMLMRVALGIHGHDLERALETYEKLSLGLFIHATPTLFNAGTPKPQMSSCFLIALKDDSIEGIFATLKTCALISKNSGGIGLHIHRCRNAGAYVRGSNGISNGVVPMLRVFNDTARYVDQGGGRRRGSFAIYLEPWHGDVLDFIQLRKNSGKEELRARDLFYGLWVPDLFMKRVQAKEKWSLFNPQRVPDLIETWGKEFEELYERYEKEGRATKVIEAQELWFAIIEAQIETGNPYLLYKDSCNAKSNQKNLGTIKCSNLCTEIIEYTSPEEVAVCNLASIALPKFLKKGTKTFDFETLRDIVHIATRNLNLVIDRNYYPVPEAERSNMRHRPIGIGVQGLADLFLLMHLSFTSEEAQRLNEDIFEAIYFAALEESCTLAQQSGSYATYAGSPISQGLLQFDMWKVTPKSDRWDWKGLRERIAKYGVRNSLLIAPMPTASTSQILGNNECFEPYTSNMYLRRVLSGEFPVVNKLLVRDLIKEGLWNEATRNQLMADNGSVQNIKELSKEFKQRYRTVWEIKQKDIIDMAAARAAYIDQSQSLNLFLESPTSGTLTSMHFYAWKQGLKTGIYYLRSRPAVDAIKFTLEPTFLSSESISRVVQSLNTSPEKESSLPPEEPECISCGS